MSKKKNKWIKKRHGFIVNIAKFFFYPVVKIKYGAKISKSKDKRQRIILSNHQTAFDQFFVAYAFNAPIYYVASEDIFSNGFISKLLKFAVNPIPIKKQATDVRAVMNCMKVAKEGGTIAIFPEGNRTYSGTTEYMSIAIVKLVKALKLPLTLFKIEGGYGVHPRWSDKVRKGTLKAYTSKTIEPSEYLSMTDEELFNLIYTELTVDERDILNTYKGNKNAEYLERAVYVCPYCGISKFESNKNTIKCLSCGRKIEYLNDKKLKGVNFDFPFNYVKEWYDYQVDFINKLNIENYFESPIFSDKVSLFNVELYKKKRLIKTNVNFIAYTNKFILNEETLLFEDISAISVLGKNKLNIYHKEKVYQIKSNKRFNALKYVNILYKYKNFIKGETNGKFLGL